jgi:hypothetical protein
VRNRTISSTFGFKAIACRQLPSDAAFGSRLVTIPMLPTPNESKALNYAEMRSLADKFQPRLLMLRLTQYVAVRDFQMNSCASEGFTPRARQLARVLAAPLEEDRSAQAALIALLREQDHETKIERSNEPEWLVGEILFAICHKYLPIPSWSSEILVGEIAAKVNHRLDSQGERSRLKDRRVGGFLKSLGFKTERLGSSGRGLRMTLQVHRQVHDVARRLNIDRSHITPHGALDLGNGGRPCSLCDEFGLSAGLRYFEPEPKRRLTRRRAPLFDEPDSCDDAGGSSSQTST